MVVVLPDARFTLSPSGKSLSEQVDDYLATFVRNIIPPADLNKVREKLNEAVVMLEERMMRSRHYITNPEPMVLKVGDISLPLMLSWELSH